MNKNKQQESTQDPVEDHVPVSSMQVLEADPNGPQDTVDGPIRYRLRYINLYSNGWWILEPGSHEL